MSGSQATLDFTAAESAFAVGTTGYIVLTGTITSVPLNDYPGYSFGPSMVDATVSLTITKTGTDYTHVLGNNGAVAHNSGFGFQQNDGAVPEPSSLTLLGIGLSALLGFRQFWRQTSAG